MEPSVMLKLDTPKIKAQAYMGGSIVEVCLSEDDQQQKVLHVDAEALCKHSDYFNTGLSDRWKQSQMIELKVAKSDWSKYENCIALMQAFSPPKLSSVEEALEILEPASRLLCPGIVKMCMDYLGCRVWSGSEKLEIYSTLSRLGLPLSSEIAQRFEGSGADKFSLLRKVLRSETRDEPLIRELIDSVMEGKSPDSETVRRMKCFFEEEWMFGWSELKAEWSKRTWRTPTRFFIDLIPLAISYDMCDAKMVQLLFSDLKSVLPDLDVYGSYEVGHVTSFFDAVRELVKKVVNGEVMLPHAARKEVTLGLLNLLKDSGLKGYVSHQHFKDLASTLGWKDYEAAIQSRFTNGTSS